MTSPEGKDNRNSMIIFLSILLTQVFGPFSICFSPSGVWLNVVRRFRCLAAFLFLRYLVYLLSCAEDSNHCCFYISYITKPCKTTTLLCNSVLSIYHQMGDNRKEICLLLCNYTCRCFFLALSDVTKTIAKRVKTEPGNKNDPIQSSRGILGRGHMESLLGRGWKSFSFVCGGWRSV